jgi:hypothetical protein
MLLDSEMKNQLSSTNKKNYLIGIRNHSVRIMVCFNLCHCLITGLSATMAAVVINIENNESMQKCYTFFREKRISLSAVQYLSTN